MPANTEVLLVITNFPDAETARSLANKLVAERLAACVNVLSPCFSTFSWQGKIETAEEYPVLIKTTLSRYATVQRLIKETHPYELPEIIAISVEQGLPEYLAWVAAETNQ